MYDHYRLVQFIPDPFIDTSFTIGALVENNKTVVFIPNHKLPPVSYIGGRTFEVMYIGIETLMKTEWKTIKQIPDTLGTLFSFGVVRNVPMSTTNNISWVEALFGDKQ